MGVDQNKDPEVSVLTRTSSSNSAPSLKSPRTPRFSEATSVNSPIDPPKNHQSFGEERTRSYVAQAQPADVGFGYLGDKRESAHIGQAIEMPMTPKSPLKSALKTPGAPPRDIKQNPLSPTWQQEDDLEKQEEHTDKQQAKDLRVKVRVRIAKMALRFTNFSCSLIVLSMLSTTFSIFNASRAIPPRNGLPPWAQGTVKWPAITLLVISCVSLVASVIVFYGYFRGGHRRAEKVAVYYTTFAVGFFLFSIVMWGIGAGVLQQGRAHSGGSDIWGWSCKENPRKDIFQNEVNYDLVCRLQNWSLVCCIIEVVVEVITITIYGIVFYRYYSKRKLRKTMEKRDTARSDLYLAQLRAQSAPNTPGLPRTGPLSPSEGGYNPVYSPRYAPGTTFSEKGIAQAPSIDAIATGGAPPGAKGESEEPGVRYITAPANPTPSKPFTLQAPPPKRDTPKLSQGGFDDASSSNPTFTLSAPGEPQQAAVPIPAAPGTPRSPPPARIASPKAAAAAAAAPRSPPPPEPMHVPAAPGEQTYESVPIPGAYSAPLQSPTGRGPSGQRQQAFGSLN